jgi:hypothetical protein
MENENQKQSPASDEAWESLIEDSRELKRKKATLFLRILGFAVIIVSFGLLMLWRNGMANPLLRKIALGLGVLGFVLYFGTRLFEIATPRIRKRKSA